MKTKKVKTMKKLLFLMIAAFMLTLTSCDKDAKNDTPTQGEVTFGVDLVIPDKDGITCDTPVHYAEIFVGETLYRLPVFMFNGMWTTQAIQLNVGPHMLNEFRLMNDNGTPENYADDLPVYAAVHSEAPYAVYVDFLVGYEFIVDAFVKKELHVELVCIERATYDDFGFEFFSVWETVIREQCFFYDLCVICIDGYSNSAYANQSGGVLLDNAAIIQIEAYRDGIFVNSWDNMEAYGEDVLCVQYADQLGIQNHFEFVLSVWLPVGGVFQWVEQYTYSFYDAEILDTDENGVNTGVIGDCAYELQEVNLSQYFDLNLPAQATFSLGGVYYPSPLGSSFDLTFSGIGAGYAIGNFTYPDYCADNDLYVSLNTPYTADIYTSMDIATAAANTNLSETQIKMLHWLVNHFESDYGLNLAVPVVSQWETIQHVIWAVTDNYAVNAAEAIIQGAAAANYMNYNPLPNQDEKYFLILKAGDQIQLQVMSLNVCPIN